MLQREACRRLKMTYVPVGGALPWTDKDGASLFHIILRGEAKVCRGA
jgi:hypothetical protein